MEISNEYSKHYNEENFWDKLKHHALKAGADLVEKVLLLYYAFKDSDTPAWAKGVIVGALGYFIFPLDAIPDITPVVGYADDLGVIAAALATVAIHIKQEHKDKAAEQMKVWFGDNYKKGE